MKGVTDGCDKEKDYGGKEAIKGYAERHKLLSLVDTMVDELLKIKPPNPRGFLVSHFSKSNNELNETPTTGTTTVAGTPSASTDTPIGSIRKQSTDGSATSEGKTARFADQSLHTELAKLWNSCSKEAISAENKLQAFGSRLKKALPQEVPPNAWAIAFQHSMTSPSALIGSVSQKNIAATPGVTTPTSQADVTIVDVGNTKFDATEDGKNEHADNVERIRFYEDSYKPPLDVFQARNSLRKWHAAGKKLWPNESIKCLENNCRTMTEHHTYGESMEVVLPLFVYSVTIFRNICWSMWVSTKVQNKDGTIVQLGRWIEVHDYQYLEREYMKWQEKQDPKYPTPLKIEIPDNESKGPWDKLKERVKSEVRCEARKSILGDSEAHTLNINDIWKGNELRTLFHDGNFINNNNDIIKSEYVDSWKGLTFMAEQNPKSNADADVDSEVAAELSLARYELLNEIDKTTGYRKFPLSDTIAWLPHPIVFQRERSSTPPLSIRKKSSVSSAKPSIEDRNTPRCNKQSFVGSPKIPISLSDIPPPGMLEYLQSRRSCEYLVYGNLKSNSLRKDTQFAPMQKLIEECLLQKNQQQYNDKLHEKLDEILDKKDKFITTLRDGLIKPKLGQGYQSEQENDQLNADPPTPLQIAHSLDIQQVTWKNPKSNEDVSLYASLSGSSFSIMTQEREESTPLYRCCEEYEDQPFWHLNATMRSLQNKIQPQLSINYNTLHQSQVTKETKGRVCKFGLGCSSDLGRGLGCLRAITLSPGLQKHLALLRGWYWACAFTSKDTHYQVKWHCKNREDIPQDYIDPRKHEQVGWWAVDYSSNKDSYSTHYLPTNCDLALGAYMIDQVRPLLYYVQEAMENMNTEIHDNENQYICAPLDGRRIKGYRGLKGAKLNRKAYSRGNVVLWSSFSSTSLDQGISHSYAAGKDASVFIIEGYSCRLIAPWSRFGREEEWLFPLNSRFQVKELLSEEQKKILGKDDLQLFEIREVNHLDMEIIHIRMCLANAVSKQSAAIVFSAVDTVTRGHGVLDLALSDPHQGRSQGGGWNYTVLVSYDASGLSPLRTSQVTRSCTNIGSDVAKTLIEIRDAGHPNLPNLQPVNKSSHINVNVTSSRLDDSVCETDSELRGHLFDIHRYISSLLELSPDRGPDFLKVTGIPDSDGRLDTLSKILIQASKPVERWELNIEMVQDMGHDGAAIKDEGASLLNEIMTRKVSIRNIDLQHNQIGELGMLSLLEGLRANNQITRLSLADTASSMPSKGRGRYHRRPAVDLLVRDFEYVKKKFHKGFVNTIGLAAAVIVSTAFVHKNYGMKCNSSKNSDKENNKWNDKKDNSSSHEDLTVHMGHQDDASSTPSRRLSQPGGGGDSQSLFDENHAVTHQGSLIRNRVRSSRNSWRPYTESEKELIQVINLRCQHNKGEIRSGILRDFNSDWPYYTARALRDVPELHFNFNSLFDHQGEKTIEFISYLVEQCLFFNLPFPKMRTALTAASRIGCCRIIKVLIQMGCSIAETDPHGETPWMKYQRQARGCIDPEIRSLLTVPKPHLVPKNPKWHCTQWKLKNFALEMIRMYEEKCEGRKDEVEPCQDLAAELIENLTFSDKTISSDQKLQQLSLLSSLAINEARKCSRLSDTPVGRMNSTLLAYKLLAVSDHDLDDVLHAEYSPTNFDISGMEPLSINPKEREHLFPTGVRRIPGSQDFVSYESFSHFAGEESGCWATAKKEPMKKRRMNDYGIYWFDYEFEAFKNSTTDDVVKTQIGSTTWQDQEEEEEEKSTERRWFTYPGISKSKECYKSQMDFLESMWEAGTEGEGQVKKRPPGGDPDIYFFKHEWETLRLNDWNDEGNISQLLPADNCCIESTMRVPSANIFDPHVNGSRATLEESRETLFKWVHLWATVNAVITLHEEKKHTIYRTMRDVPGSVMFDHMNLKEGDVFGIPEISLWSTEKRFDKDSGTMMTEDQFNSRYDDEGRMFHLARRKIFPLHDTENHVDCGVQLLSRGEFNEISKTRPFHYKNGFGLMTHSLFELLAKDEKRETKKVRWDDSCCVVESVFPEEKHHQSANHIIRFIAVGNMRTASIVNLRKNEDAADLMLAALETFVVENVDLQRIDTDMVLTIKLVSRGSLFTTDQELKIWCQQVRLQVSACEAKLSNCSVEATRTTISKEGTRPVRTTKTVGSQLRSTSLDKDSFIYFSSDAQRLSADERQQLVKEIHEVLKPVNIFSFLKLGSGDYEKNHNAVVAPQIVPYTTRPSYTFLRALDRVVLDGSDSQLPHIPEIGLKAENVLNDNTNRTIKISATEIGLQYERVDTPADKRFNEEKELNPEACKFDLKQMYGEEVFEISMDEIKQLIRSTKVTTSSIFPRKFYTALVGDFAGNEPYQMFMNVFRTTPFLSIAEDKCWAECLHSQTKIIEDAVTLANTRLNEAMVVLDDADSLPKQIKFAKEKKYRNEVILEMNTKYKELLDDKNAIHDQQRAFKDWVDDVKMRPEVFGFQNKRHAVLILGKSLTELSTEVCVSQKGYFFTSGTDGKHNHICKKTDRSIVFLAAPGLDFCYHQPTLQEAPKYFTKVHDPNDSNKVYGWATFRPGKRAELHHRLKILYTCIFKAAQKQNVRNMSVLPLGLGVFTTNLQQKLKKELMEIYFKVQYELLAEHDWGFENYYINPQQFSPQARRLLDKGLHEGNDYNNYTDRLHLRCNIIFHNKDAKFLATQLASEGKAPSFLNPSDSQAVMQGFLGMYWEKGRSFNYVGEEDWAATSTGVLASFKVAGGVLCLQDKGHTEQHSTHTDDETSSLVSVSSKAKLLSGHSAGVN